MDEKRQWVVNPAAGDSLTIEAERIVLLPDQARVTFYNGDDVVASFVGLNSVYPAP